MSWMAGTGVNGAYYWALMGCTIGVKGACSDFLRFSPVFSGFLRFSPIFSGVSWLSMFFHGSPCLYIVHHIPCIPRISRVLPMFTACSPAACSHGTLLLCHVSGSRTTSHSSNAYNIVMWPGCLPGSSLASLAMHPAQLCGPSAHRHAGPITDRIASQADAKAATSGVGLGSAWLSTPMLDALAGCLSRFVPGNYIGTAVHGSGCLQPCLGRLGCAISCGVRL